MNKKVATLIFIVLILIIISVLFIVYKMISNVKVQSRPIETTIDTNVSIDMNKDSWISKIAKQGNENYLLPANEISIKLNLENEIKDNFKYRVLINRADENQFSLLNPFLQLNKFKYSYYKREKSVKVAVLIDSDRDLDTLLNQLDTYSISYHVER